MNEIKKLKPKEGASVKKLEEYGEARMRERERGERGCR
jgi:hypothetical protein